MQGEIDSLVVALHLRIRFPNMTHVARGRSLLFHLSAIMSKNIALYPRPEETGLYGAG
jgi:hypothetical protein